MRFVFFRGVGGVGRERYPRIVCINGGIRDEIAVSKVGSAFISGVGREDTQAMVPLMMMLVADASSKAQSMKETMFITTVQCQSSTYNRGISSDSCKTNHSS